MLEPASEQPSPLCPMVARIALCTRHSMMIMDILTGTQETIHNSFGASHAWGQLVRVGKGK